jgi:hypothetical protein
MRISDYMVNKMLVYNTLKYTALGTGSLAAMIGVSDCIGSIVGRGDVEVAKTVLRQQGYTVVENISADAGRRLIADCVNRGMKPDIKIIPLPITIASTITGKKPVNYGIRCEAQQTIK